MLGNSAASGQVSQCLWLGLSVMSTDSKNENSIVTLTWCISLDVGLLVGVGGYIQISSIVKVLIP